MKTNGDNKKIKVVFSGNKELSIVMSMTMISLIKTHRTIFCIDKEKYELVKSEKKYTQQELDQEIQTAVQKERNRKGKDGWHPQYSEGWHDGYAMGKKSTTKDTK